MNATDVATLKAEIDESLNAMEARAFRLDRLFAELLGLPPLSVLVIATPPAWTRYEEQP